MNSIVKFLKSGAGFISQPTHKRTLGIVIMLVLAAAVSLTVVLSQQQQTIRQRAAEPAEQLAKGYVLCGSGFGFRQCQNDITVSASCDEGKNKCLSETANFSGSDRINGKSLTCCLSDRYREVDGVCTLVTESYSISLNESPICNSPEKPKPTEPKESDYPLCWGGSPNGPNLLQCESGVTVDTPCSSEEFNKCLSAHKVRDADRIDGKYLTCCKAKEYGLVNDKCTLVADGEFSDPQCTMPIPSPTSPATSESTESDYPLCWGGSFTVNALSGCELNITEGASCSSGYNKCLSVDQISGADKIDGKYLTCCPASEYGFTGNNECTLVKDGEYSDPACSIPIVAAADTAIPTPTPTLTPTPPPAGVSICPVPAAPTELDCDIAANKISWKPVDEATGYNVRINSDPLDDWKNDCTITQSAGDVCNDNVVPGTSEGYTLSGGKVLRTYNFVPGTSYHIAVHTVNTCGGGVAAEKDCSRPAPGDTIITLPAGAFNYLFTDTKKAVPELKTSKDQSLTIYLYSSDVDPKNDLRGENAIKKTHESKLSNSEENPLSFNLGQVPAGTYKILLKSPKYLRALEDTRTITSAGGTIILALTKPLANGAGDANGDNSIDILDYNIIQGCIGIRADAICTDREGADVNDSGVANEIDFNVWKTSMSFKDGD